MRTVSKTIAAYVRGAGPAVLVRAQAAPSHSQVSCRPPPEFGQEDAPRRQRRLRRAGAGDFETLTLIQTGRIQRIPVLLFGRDFWGSVINFQAPESPRVGVFVCHCGLNIAGTVNVKEITDAGLGHLARL